MDCLFCKIASKEIPSQQVYEDKDVIAFLDIQPRAPGHCVVIPKSHAKNILDLEEDKIAPLFSAVKKVTGALKRALSPDGFTIGINHGKASGQAVDHIHVHIMPRFHGDKGGSLHTVVENPPKEPLERLRARIVQELF